MIKWHDTAGTFEIDFDLMSWAFSPKDPGFTRRGFLSSVCQFGNLLFFSGSSPVNESVTGQYCEDYGVAYVKLNLDDPLIVVAGAIDETHYALYEASEESMSASEAL